jgi:uncharacterized protein (TIGR02246 family)
MISTYVRITVTILFLLSCSHASLWAQTQPNTTDADSSAIKQVVAGYSEAFNRHDAHATATLFAEDADFTNLRGTNRHGQKEIEQIFVTLYAGILKDAHRTDTVKNVRFLTPKIAVVDDLWEMTGARAPDGSENPDRKGLFDWVLTKVNGQWRITVFHEVEFPK